MFVAELTLFYDTINLLHKTIFPKSANLLAQDHERWVLAVGVEHEIGLRLDQKVLLERFANEQWPLDQIGHDHHWLRACGVH
jgi:hypothetical protein